jgi:hypothetical protein
VRREPPRKAKSELIDVLPITADDVEKMWRAASRRGPWPTRAWCEEWAPAFEDLRERGAYSRARALSRRNARAVAGIRALLADIEEDLQVTNRREAVDAAELRYSGAGYGVLGKVYEDLAKALPVLAPDTGTAPIWDAAADIAWRIGRDALHHLYEHAGTSRDSVAVKFAAAALARLGFRNGDNPPSAEAIAKRITATEKKS